MKYFVYCSGTNKFLSINSGDNRKRWVSLESLEKKLNDCMISYDNIAKMRVALINVLKMNETIPIDIYVIPIDENDVLNIRYDQGSEL
tara:strand:+ start:82 stop:345 length:264 start_codon:yes stop_codon:yes gene_type:complete